MFLKRMYILLLLVVVCLNINYVQLVGGSVPFFYILPGFLSTSSVSQNEWTAVNKAPAITVGLSIALFSSVIFFSFTYFLELCC